MTDEHENNREDEYRQLWKDWRKQIAEDLDKYRPERYDEGELDWLDPIIERARGRMPVDDAIVIRRHLDREVRNVESQASKRGNKLVREYNKGLRPLDWRLFGPCPIVVGKTHVRLDKASRQDVRDACDQAHAENLANYNRSEEALDGYRYLERRAAAQGFEQLSLLGDLPPRGLEAKAA